jgi:hypothetical protein
MKRDGFPWLAHRTLAEVARTDALLAKATSRREKFTNTEAREFARLMQKVYRHNPPPDGGSAAA